MSRRLTGNTLILLLNNVGSAALSFLISVVVKRGLGLDALGQYTFIMAWIAPFVTLADFGMGSLITRDVARSRAAAIPLLQTATRVLILVAGIILIVAWLLVPSLNLAPAVATALAVAALLIVLDPWYGLYTALFRAFQHMRAILFVNVGGFVLQLAFSIIAIYTGTGLLGISAVLIAVNILQLGVMWWLWRGYRVGGADSSTVENTIRPGVRQVMKAAWPFALAAVLNTLQLRLNVLLLEHLSGDAAVGLYAAANRFVEAGRLVPGALFGALFPALASLAAQPDAMRQTFLKATGLLLAFAAIFGLSMTVFGAWLLRITYDLPGATPILILLAWALLPALLRAILTLYLYSLGREQFVNKITLIALAAQAVTGWLLIGRWGVIGAALTVGITEGGMVVCLGYSLRGHLFRFGTR